MEVCYNEILLFQQQFVLRFAVLDGAVAVPCSPQSAKGGLTSCLRVYPVGSAKGKQ